MTAGVKMDFIIGILFVIVLGYVVVYLGQRT